MAAAGYPNGFSFTLVVSPSRPGPYSGQIGVIERLSSGAIPSALVRVEGGGGSLDTMTARDMTLEYGEDGETLERVDGTPITNPAAAFAMAAKAQLELALGQAIKEFDFSSVK
mgnify:CR=1 FL=1